MTQEEFKSNYKSRILRSSAARLAAAGASLGISFFMMPFVLRTLGDHQYGLWIVVASVESYYYFLDLGLNMAASRFVTMRMAADDYQGVNEAVSTAFAIFVVLGGVVALTTLAVAGAVPWFVQADDVATVRILLLLAGLTVAAGFPIHAYAGIVYGQMRHDLVEMSAIIRRVIEAALVYVALSRGYGLIAYSSILAVSNLAMSVYFYWIAMKMWPQLAVRLQHFRKDLSIELFSYSAWSTLSHLGDILRFRIDALVIGGYLGTTAVTHYNVGYRLGEIGCGLVYRATNFMSPLYARYHARGEMDEIRSKLVDFTRINAYLAFSAGLVLILIGDAFLKRWVGIEYSDAYPVMVVLLTGRLVEAVATPTSNVLYAVANIRFYAYVNIVEAIANVVLSVALVTRLGIVGVAIGTSVPMLITRLVILPLYTCRTVQLAPYRYYMSIVPSLSVSAAVLVVMHFGMRPLLVGAGYGRLAAIAMTAAAVTTFLHIVLVLSGDERSWMRGVALSRYRQWRA